MKCTPKFGHNFGAVSYTHLAAGSEYGLAQAIKGAKIMAVVALRHALCK